MLKEVTEATPFIKPFPAFEEVFGEPLALHTKHFLPLLSVNAVVIHPDLDRWLHFVTPIEPLLELDVGYFTEEYHDFYNMQGQIAFHLANGRYSFTGDFGYFAYESGAIFKAFPGQEDEIHEDYRLRRTTYEATRQRFLQTGRLYGPRVDLSDPSQTDRYWPFVDQLGGDPVVGNWGSELPRNKSGKPFRFIGEVKGFLYCENAGFILLYYDPDEEIALLRLDWT